MLALGACACRCSAARGAPRHADGARASRAHLGLLADARDVARALRLAPCPPRRPLGASLAAPPRGRGLSGAHRSAADAPLTALPLGYVQVLPRLAVLRCPRTSPPDWHVAELAPTHLCFTARGQPQGPAHCMPLLDGGRALGGTRRLPLCTCLSDRSHTTHPSQRHSHKHQRDDQRHEWNHQRLELVASEFELLRPRGRCLLAAGGYRLLPRRDPAPWCALELCLLADRLAGPHATPEADTAVHGAQRAGHLPGAARCGPAGGPSFSRPARGGRARALPAHWPSPIDWHLPHTSPPRRRCAALAADDHSLAGVVCVRIARPDLPLVSSLLTTDRHR
mmetsp:Transcript_81958/g.163211  ORF Transcript_81958/g.163211 Transcript_81958/m.163211 type:complete len:337 (+) Transcript_81958:588-1598(+)